MYNPYADIDFSSTKYIASVSHAHCTKQSVLDTLHNNGIQHVAISNYYPSEPCYPLSEYFIPYDEMIQCPNAEHHNFYNPFGVTGRLHINGLGSLFTSGSPSGETPLGMGGTDWKDGITQILAGLQFQDAGGCTINHPAWTGINAKNCCDMLDYDPRVLGIEIYNQSCEEYNDIPNGWAVDTWDIILKTGRRCFGFAVPDHQHEINNIVRGKNILLCDGSEYGCLKAYRKGCFYAKVGIGDLKITSIVYRNGVFSAHFNNAANVELVTDSFKKTFNNVTSISENVNIDDYVFVRLKITDSNDTLFTNPIFLNKQGTPLESRKNNIGIRIALFS